MPIGREKEGDGGNALGHKNGGVGDDRARRSEPRDSKGDIVRERPPGGKGHGGGGAAKSVRGAGLSMCGLTPWERGWGDADRSCTYGGIGGCGTALTETSTKGGRPNEQKRTERRQ